MLAGERRIRNLLSEWASALTSLDSKFLTSLAGLTLHPGQLTRAYIEGRRVQYTSPITLFLLANLVYFFAPSLSDFNLTFWEQYNVQLYKGLSRPLIDAKLALTGMTIDEYGPLFTAQSNNIAKTLIAINVPVFAGLLLLLQGRESRFFYADHIVFALHFYAFLLIFLMLFPVLGAALAGLVDLLGATAYREALDLIGSIMVLGLVAIYLGVATVSAYSWGGLRAVLSVPVCVAGIFVANQINRFFLLLVTLVTT